MGTKGSSNQVTFVTGVLPVPVGQLEQDLQGIPSICRLNLSYSCPAGRVGEAVKYALAKLPTENLF